MNDENYTGEICQLIPQLREKFESLRDKRLGRELIKMEIRDYTLSFAKRKARAASEKLKSLNNWKSLIIKYVIVIIYQT